MRREELDLLCRRDRAEMRVRDEIVRRYYTPVLRFFELRAPNDADDLAQRTFLACFEGLDGYRREGPFRSYLFGIARNQLLLFIRSRRRWDSAEFFEERVVARHTSLSTLMARQQEQHLLLRALCDLDAPSQMLVALYYWEGMPTSEIGQVLEVPPSTVTTRLARTRAAIRDSVCEFTRPGPLRERVLADIDGWTRSVAVATHSPPAR